MKKLIVLFCTLLLLLSACSPKATLDFSDPENALPDDLTQAIDAEVERLIEESPLPGIVVGIHQGGQPVFTKAYGEANIESGTSASIDTRYYVGMISETFTAVMIMQMVNEGEISLDDPVTRFFPEFTGASEVTIEHLLTHTSGLMDDDMIKRKIGFEDAPHNAEDRLALAKLIFETYTVKPTGMHVYSNFGYTLLGMIVEQVSGMTYADYLADNIFEPAEMKNSQQCLTAPVGTAQGYVSPSGVLKPEDMKDLSSFSYAAESICSTVGDLIKYVHAMRNGLVLKEESFAQMVTPVSNNTIASGFGYGMGMMIYPPAGETDYVGHLSGIPGYGSWMMYFPQQDLTLVILTNRYMRPSDLMPLYELHGFLSEKLAEEFPVE